MQVSEAPERIWATGIKTTGAWNVNESDNPNLRNHEVEYIRADKAMQWNDNMDEAPKDGRWILGYKDSYNIQDRVEVYAWNAFGSDDDLWVNASDSNDYDEQPTHWMPLPEPPR